VRKKHKIKKKKNQNNFIWRLFFSLTSILILVSLIYPLISRKFSLPCANDKSCSESLKLKVENNAIGFFNNQKIIPPKISLLFSPPKQTILGAKTQIGEKHIYVDLSKQILYAYQGKTLFMQTYVSTGRWGKTPKGEFTIWSKLLATRMTGGNGADFYDLPNVPYVMFFENSEVAGASGFSLHGAYWHNNFGHTMSHGCVNMRIIDAEKLYNWANPTSQGNVTNSTNENPGTKVTIYGDDSS
jgi:hypothetical protein